MDADSREPAFAGPEDAPDAANPGPDSIAEQADPSPPTSGWVQPATSPGLSRGARLLFSAIVWLAAILLLAAAGWVTAEGIETANSPWRIGYIAGTVAGGLALGTAIRWVWLRIRRRHAERPLLSPWIPVVGVFVAATMLASAGASALEPAVPTDPRTLFQIGPGYELVEADPEVVTEMEAEFEDSSGRLGQIAVTNIEAADGSVGLLVVVDAHATDLTSAITLEGMIIGASEGQPRREVVAGRQTMFLQAEGISVVGWVDAPLIAIIYAVDDPTARAMAESMMLAND